MKRVLLIAALVVATVAEGHAQDHRAVFKHISVQAQSDPRGAFDAMLSLAQTGYAPAIDRMGYYFRHGIGTDTDLAAARHWYTRAVAGGHPWAAASLARVEIASDNGAAAHVVLKTAVQDNLPGAKRLLATAHIDRKLGTASDPEAGRRLLETLVTGGDSNAARDWALRINWGRLDGRLPDTAVALIVPAAIEGDDRFD